MKNITTLPTAFIHSLQDVTGFNEQDFINIHTSGQQVTSIRLNPLKLVSNTQSAISNPQLKNVPWCETGRYLSERPSFTFDPSFHAGAYYVQEASSMFLDLILKQIFVAGEYPKKVLDLCAAPGGKSTLLASALPQSFIISNEVIKSRVTVLAENISKWGSSNVVVTHNDPRHFQQLPGYFDLMLVDAPCSGSGLFRKDVKAIDEWSEENVEMCSMRQQRILSDAIPALQKDGFLIYSTCSYSKEENENICDWIMDHLKLEPVALVTDPSWGVVETRSLKHHAKGYRFYPDQLQGEGFFVACFKKLRDEETYYSISGDLHDITKAERELIFPWLKNSDQLCFFKQKETIIAYPMGFKYFVSDAQEKLNVRKSGVAVGSIKGKDFIPHHELAISFLVSDHLSFIDVDYDNAIQFLKRKELTLDLPPRGWMLVKYNGLNLGWIKVLQNRINNYYPTEWRILKD